jgi:hypothetical protein
VSSASGELPIVAVDAPARGTAQTRAGLLGRARTLAWAGIVWHVVEAAVALVAGVVAGSVALVGFGADSSCCGGWRARTRSPSAVRSS